MLIVRETFMAKPGMASKLAKVFKDSALPRMKLRVMTDLVGEFNTVVMETEVADLAAFEKEWKEYMEDATFREKIKGYTDLYVKGRREIYRVV